MLNYLFRYLLFIKYFKDTSQFLFKFIKVEEDSFFVFIIVI